jgi:hypothetical protein
LQHATELKVMQEKALAEAERIDREEILRKLNLKK